jgi:hypothetical protein
LHLSWTPARAQQYSRAFNFTRQQQTSPCSCIESWAHIQCTLSCTPLLTCTPQPQPQPPPPLAPCVHTQGLQPCEGHELATGETTTKGLETLAAFAADSVKAGARFAKWRAVLRIDESKGFPSEQAVQLNAQQLAEYAAVCQAAGLVPVVEPEILIEGPHSAEVFGAVTERVVGATVAQMWQKGVQLEGCLLKPQMVIPVRGSGDGAGAGRGQGLGMLILLGCAIKGLTCVDGCKLQQWLLIFVVCTVCPLSARQASLCEPRQLHKPSTDVAECTPGPALLCQRASTHLHSSLYDMYIQCFTCLSHTLCTSPLPEPPVYPHTPWSQGASYPGPRSTPAEVAAATLTSLRRVVPAAIPGIMFLSGGQSEEEATVNLNALNQLGGGPGPGGQHTTGAQR